MKHIKKSSLGYACKAALFICIMLAGVLGAGLIGIASDATVQAAPGDLVCPNGFQPTNNAQSPNLCTKLIGGGTLGADDPAARLLCPAPYTIGTVNGQTSCTASTVPQCTQAGNAVNDNPTCATTPATNGADNNAPLQDGTNDVTPKDGQTQCDTDFEGTVYDEEFNDETQGHCKTPENEADCKKATENMGEGGPEYTFQAATGAAAPAAGAAAPAAGSEVAAGADEGAAKCVKADDDTCPIPKTGDGSTAMRWIACPVTEGLNYLIIGCAGPVPLEEDGDTPQGAQDGANAEDGGDDAAAADKKTCTGGLNGLIRSFLYTDTNRIFGNNSGGQDADAANDATSNAYKASWGVFRTIAVGVVIIAGLVMIVSEALGIGFVDAYTIRKLLPRLLVVAVGVTLSWSLCAFFITFFNDLGAWAQDLITFPFEGLKAQEYNAGWILSQWFTAVGAGAAALAGTFYLITLGWIGILGFLLTILLALLIAAAVLLVRQMVILLCVIVSPLAIACAVLPNTQKLFSLWFSTFIRTLIMYPVVIAFLSLGIVFSWIASQTPSLLNGFIAIFAYALPYFMLPYAFKLSGGAMATVANLVQERSKPLFDKAKEKRQAQHEAGMQKFHDGNLMKAKWGFNYGKAHPITGERKRFSPGGAINQLGLMKSAGLEAFRPKFGRGGKNNRWGMRLDKGRYDARMSSVLDEKAAHIAEKNEEFKSLSKSDPHMEVASNGADEKSAYNATVRDRTRRETTKALRSAGVDSVDQLGEDQKKELHGAIEKMKHETHEQVQDIETGPGFSKATMVAAQSAWRQTSTGPEGDGAGLALFDVSTKNVRSSSGYRSLGRRQAAGGSGQLAATGRFDAATGAGTAQGNYDLVASGTQTEAQLKETFAQQQREQTKKRYSEAEIMGKGHQLALASLAPNINDEFKAGVVGTRDATGNLTGNVEVKQEEVAAAVDRMQGLRNNFASARGENRKIVKNAADQLEAQIARDRAHIVKQHGLFSTQYHNYEQGIQRGLASSGTFDNRTNVGDGGVSSRGGSRNEERQAATGG